MKTYLSVFLQNCASLNSILVTKSNYPKNYLRNCIHRFKPQDDVTFPDSLNTISSQLPFNFKEVFCKIQTSFRFEELIPEPVFCGK